MMQKLKEEITAAANRELNRANEQFPLFTSKHEGVAVAYEELEESKEALEELETSFKCLWDDVRGKETPCYLKVLWTSRAGADLENAVEWCRLQGLVFDAVNEPLPEQIKRWGNDTRKIYADYYIDDKNMTIAQVESTMNQIKEIMEEIKE